MSRMCPQTQAIWLPVDEAYAVFGRGEEAMKRLALGLAIVLVAAAVLVGVTVGPAESAGAELSLKASATT